MYSDIWEDPTTSIAESTEHTSEALSMKDFLKLGVFITATNFPNGTTLYLEVAGLYNPTVLDWESIYDVKMKTGEHYAIEGKTAFPWFRYRIVVPSGGSVTDLKASITRKGW